MLRLLADPTSGLKANINCSEAPDLGSNLSSGSNLVVGTRKCYDGSQVLPSLALRREQAFALPQLFTYEHSSNTRGQFAVLKHYWSAPKQPTSARQQSFVLVVHQRV